jgi:hypothetical protein
VGVGRRSTSPKTRACRVTAARRHNRASRGSMCRFEHRNLRDGRTVNCGSKSI